MILKIQAFVIIYVIFINQKYLTLVKVENPTQTLTNNHILKHIQLNRVGF